MKARIIQNMLGSGNLSYSGEAAHMSPKTRYMMFERGLHFRNFLWVSLKLKWESSMPIRLV